MYTPQQPHQLQVFSTEGQPWNGSCMYHRIRPFAGLLLFGKWLKVYFVGLHLSTDTIFFLIERNTIPIQDEAMMFLSHHRTQRYLFDDRREKQNERATIGLVEAERPLQKGECTMMADKFMEWYRGAGR